MGDRVRIEILGRNDFWRNAVLVEWRHQFPDRELGSSSSDCFIADREWLPDLERVAVQCFSSVRVAPADPGRRQIFRHLLSSFDRK